MMTKPHLHWATAAVLLFMALPSQAAGWVSILKNTPAEAFDDEDLKMFLSAATKTLNAEGKPEKVSWNNPASGAGGHFQEIGQSVSKSGLSCKRVRFGIYAQNRAEKTAVWTACLGKDGRWLLSSAR